MSIFRRIFRIDPQRDFSKGRKAFDQGQYSLASKIFQKTYKQFNTIDMKIISLENAAIAAEYADMYNKSQELYYNTILIKLENNEQAKGVLPDIEKAIQMVKLSEKPSIPLYKLLFMKFLIFLSEIDFNQLASLYKKIEFGSSDKYSHAIEKTWSMIHSAETFREKESLPQVDLPKEFTNISDTAEQVMQRCSLCAVVLKNTNQSELIRKGTDFSLSATVTAHAPVSIQKINLKIGARGRILTSTTPEFPLNLRQDEDYRIIFSLVPNLPGEWILGPLSLTYSIPSEAGEFPIVSKPISLMVEDAAPVLKLSMDFETIEEDLEYLITISAENIGKTSLQDVKIVSEIPEGIKIREGTKEKIISTLGEGELFQYEIRVQFPLNKTHLSGHIIRANGFIEDKRRLSKCSIKLGGR